MKNKLDNILRITPEKLLARNDSSKQKALIMVFALVRNDVSDLIHLHDLLIRESGGKNLTLEENAQITGRQIYLMRLLLGHLNEFIIFLRKKESDILADTKMVKILEGLSSDSKTVWEVFLLIAKGISVKGNIKVKPWVFEILRLADRARNDLTFHYQDSAHHLGEGYKKAFYTRKKNKKNKYACVTEMKEVKKDRAYYIDLAIQVFLEEKTSTGDLFKKEPSLIELTAILNKLLTEILSTYHKSICE